MVLTCTEFVRRIRRSGEENLKRLQKVLQNSCRLLKTSILAELQFMSIYVTEYYVCMVYKALNCLTPKFTHVNLRHSNNTRSSSQGNLQTKSFKTNYGNCCQGSLIWNVICLQIYRKSTSLYAFKKQFKSDIL